MGAGRFGFQFGAQASESVLQVMSQRDGESLLTSTFTLGGDISVAVGPVGAPSPPETSGIGTTTAQRSGQPIFS